MKYGTTILLFVAVLGLGAYIWLVERKAETSEKREERARYALNVEAAKVTRFSVVTDTLQITAEKEDRQWMLTHPARTRADAGAVDRLLEELERLPKGEVIGEEDRKKLGLTLADYGLDRPRVRIAIGQPGTEQVILIGRDARLGRSLYIKEESRPEVVSTTTNLLGALPATVTDIRDRRLFQGFPSDVTRISIRRASGILELSRDAAAGWRIQKPVEGRAAEAAVQDLLDGLFEMRISEFVAESVAAASLYGLDEPAAQISLSTRSGEQSLSLGRFVDHAPDQTYAALKGTEEVFAVPTNIVAALQVRTHALRDPRLITLPAYEIGYMEIQQGERAVKLMQTGGVWYVTEPTSFKADEERVQIVLSEWTGAKIEAYNDEPVTNAAEAGLAPPAYKLVLAKAPPPAPSTNAPAAAAADGVTVLVSTADAGHDRYMVAVEGENSLYLVGSAPVQALSVKALAFRDHLMMAVDPAQVRSIAVQSAGVEQGIEREGTNVFRAAGGATAAVDTRAVDALLGAVRAVHAVDLIAEDAPDLAAYGLDAPPAVLTLGLSAEAGLGKSMLFGRETGDGYVFTLIKGQDVVFTLEKALAETLTGTLYKDEPAPDAQKVESGNQRTADTP